MSSEDTVGFVVRNPGLPNDPIERAVAALTEPGPPTDVLESLLEADPEPRVRVAALTALVRRLGADAAASCTQALGDPAAAVRRRAAEHAAAVPVATDALTPLLREDDATVVEATAWALGERGDVAAIDALTACAIEHENPLARESAVAALGAIGDPEGLPAILTACADKPPVRRRAVLALAPFEGPEVDAALAHALADRDWQVRQAAEDLRREP
ncbi:MAG: HEAT repeat domain-containing protein [Acidimicrobiia bacterium]